MTTSPRDDLSERRRHHFASKRDLWLVIVLWAAALGLLQEKPAQMGVTGSGRTKEGIAVLVLNRHAHRRETIVI